MRAGVAILLLLASCGPERPAPLPAPARKPLAVAPAPAPAPPTSAVESVREADPSPATKPRFTPPPMKPSPKEISPTSGSFTFRTMDHLKAYVIINGERYSDTSCLWALSLATEFDPKIPVGEWPPPGAAWAGGGAGQSIEIAVEGGLYDTAGQERLKREFPHLEPGEQVLFVKAEILGHSRQGALRLKLVGEHGAIYRHTTFTPIQSMEEENASRFARSVWFQRERVK